MTLALGVALLLALVFALRFGMAIRQWSVAATDPDLAGWMTPRFVAHSWNVPPEAILQSLPLAPDETGRRVTLAELAEARGVPLAQLLEELRLAIATYRAGPAP
jgi:hypothetical protein